MIGLRTFEGRSLELSPGTTISVELNNALLADADNNGAYALPFTIPRTAVNQLALGFPELLDNAAGQARRYERTDVFDDGRHLLSGTLTLLRITASTYELTLLFGASAVMTKLKTMRLRDLTLGGFRVWQSGGDVLRYNEQLVAHMTAVLANPDQYDYVFAPYANNAALADHPEGWPSYANFNAWGLYGGFTLTTGYVPGYAQVGLPFSPFPDFYPFAKRGCCPCVKLRYLVYALFRELRIPFEEDFFDAETSQLVVLGDALADDQLITGYAAATQQGLKYDDFWFRLGDVLPDLTCAELLRKLADTFFLDLSTSPLGVVRLRRSQKLLALPPALELSRAATPGPASDVSASLPYLTTAYLIEGDGYTPEHYRLVDANQLGDAVATVADLPAHPDFPHQVRYVTSLNCYYQYNDAAWKFYSERLDVPTFGQATAESTVTVTQGIELLLELTGPTQYVLPVPGGKWDDPVVAQPAAVPVVRIPIFGQRAYAPSFNCIERSSALRLAFYRGLQPYQNASQGTYPMLAAGNLDLQGNQLGDYSLRLDGAAGTASQFGAAILPLKANPYTVTWPVWLTEEQFYQLDTCRQVEIDGLRFVVKQVQLTFPIRQPAQMQLVLMPPAYHPI